MWVRAGSNVGMGGTGGGKPACLRCLSSPPGLEPSVRAVPYVHSVEPLYTNVRECSFACQSLTSKIPSTHNRLASIYKPERRQRLQQQGFTLAGNMGDQHSDLAGLSPAAASWKLPNPVYYIL